MLLVGGPAESQGKASQILQSVNVPEQLTGCWVLSYSISNLVNLICFPQCPSSALNISEFLSLTDKAYFSSDGDEPSIDFPPQMMAFLHSKLS